MAIHGLHLIPFLLLSCLFVRFGISQVDTKPSSEYNNKWALVVTLAGTKKLSSYFEWSCRSIGSSADSFDMLVFHEGNAKLKEIVCAKNVKFIDLGENGLSKLTVNEILQQNTHTGNSNNNNNNNNSTNSYSSSEENRGELTTMLAEVILHIPRYLIEIKPMTGSLFRDWLGGYTHWSYTDPDIIWANLTEWVDARDADHFDIVTFAKTFDAGRLFVRGQFALHKNIDKVNHVWKSLSYFRPRDFTQRVVSAVRMLRMKKSSDYIFVSNFHSAEGWYSQTVFKSGLSVKIVGRGFDDYSRDAVVIKGGHMSRWSKEDMIAKLQLVKGRGKGEGDVGMEIEVGDSITVYGMTPMQVKKMDAYHHNSACYMQWLPGALRYCLAAPKYDKVAALVQDTQSDIRLQKVGESYCEEEKPGNGDRVWYANDEKLSRRQVHNSAAFFHFRHWDDYASVGMSTDWGKYEVGTERITCMILYLRDDGVMAFEGCDVVATKVRSGLLQGKKERSSGKKKGEETKTDGGIASSGGDGGGKRGRKNAVVGKRPVIEGRGEGNKKEGPGGRQRRRGGAEERGKGEETGGGDSSAKTNEIEEQLEEVIDEGNFVKVKGRGARGEIDKKRTETMWKGSCSQRGKSMMLV